MDTIRTLIENGVTQQKICEILRISRPSWEKYKKEKKELFNALNTAHVKKSENLDALKEQIAANAANREEEVKMLEASMYKLALGYSEEVTKYIKTRDDVVPVTETVIFPPNFQALRFLLMNWGGYMSEPAAQAQREREFEHKKTMDEKNNW